MKNGNVEYVKRQAVLLEEDFDFDMVEVEYDAENPRKKSDFLTQFGYENGLGRLVWSGHTTFDKQKGKHTIIAKYESDVYVV